MCVIQGETEEIKNTKIYVGRVDDVTQFTVYSNEVLPKDKEVAMILPVPSSNIKILDLTNYTDIFESLGKLFPFKARSRGLMLGKPKSFNYTNSTLEITQHGSYDASIVPTTNDFNRIDDEHFKINPNMYRFLERDYPNYSFIVCKIRKGAKYHPFGYTHGIEEIHGTKLLFVPTKHYHNGSDEHADWDHKIYVLGGSTLPFRNRIGSSVRTYEKPIFGNNYDSLPALPLVPKGDVKDLDQITIDSLFGQNTDFRMEITV